MLGMRMIVILQHPVLAEEAIQTVLGAIASAHNPFAVRFAVPASLEEAFTDVFQSTNALKRSDLLFYPDLLGLEGAATLLSDETHFLALTGPFGFSYRWDAVLYQRYRKITNPMAILTGAISVPTESEKPEARLPAFAENFRQDGILIQHGLPLVCCASPVRTFIIEPTLFFGRTLFLKQVELKPETLSIAAFLANISVYALDRAVLWPVNQLPEKRLSHPEENTQMAAALTRFEQQTGIRFDQKRAGVRATWGLFGPLDRYKQELPPSLRLSQRRNALLNRIKESRMPLCVTALIDLPEPAKPMPVYVLRYGFMRAIRELPLQIYTGGSQERYLRANDPNAWNYPNGDTLPKKLLTLGINERQLFTRSKLLLLKHAARNHPEFTHIAWVNADILKHPICPDATPDFSAWMDNTVHLALVDGFPDCSFMLVPTKLIKLLVQEVEAITQFDLELAQDLSEEAMMHHIISQHSDLFTTHVMPEKHLLMLAAFAPELLSEHYRVIIQQNRKPQNKNQQRWGRHI